VSSNGLLTVLTMYLSNENLDMSLLCQNISGGVSWRQTGGVKGRQGGVKRAAVGAAQGGKGASPGASHLRAGGVSPNVGAAVGASVHV
jgi:hypothetical protein